MARAENNFNGGTSGVTITTGNSGGAPNDAFDDVQVQTGATGVYSTSQIFSGTNSARLASGSTASRSMLTYEATIGTITNDIWGRAYCYFTANPTTEFFLFRAREDNTARAIVVLGTDGKLKIKQGDFTTRGTSSAAVPLNQWIRIEWKFRFDPTAGHLVLRIYHDPNLAANSQTQELRHETSNTGTQANQFDAGITNAIANVPNFHLDSVIWDSAGDGSFGFIGPESGIQIVSPTGIPSTEAMGSLAVTQPGGPADITWSILTQPASTDTDGTSYVTPSITPGANKLILAVIANGLIGGAGAVSSITGCNLTWEEVITKPRQNHRTSIWRAMGAAPTTGQVTINYAATQSNFHIKILEFSGTDTSGTNGSGAIVQTASGELTSSTISVALTAAPAAGNVGIGSATWNSSNSTYTEDTGWVRQGSITSGTAPSDQNVVDVADPGLQTFSGTISDSREWGAVNVEIKAGVIGILQIRPESIVSTEAFGTPQIATIQLSGLQSREEFGTLVIANLLVINPLGINSQEQVSAPIVVLNQLFPLGISSQEAFGSPSVITTQTVSPVGILSVETFGLTTVLAGITPVGIGTLEAFGVPRVSLINAYADEPWDGLAVLDVHSVDGSTFFSLSIADVGEQSFGDQTPFEGASGSQFILRFEWDSSRSGVTPFPTLARISFREPGTSTQIGASNLSLTSGSGLTGLSGVITQVCHFDENPIDGIAGTPRSGRMEMHLYLENKVGTNPITWACSSSGLGSGSAPLPFNFARGELNATIDAITPPGIGPEEAFGTAIVTTTRTISNTGNIESLETFGTGAVNPSGVAISVPSTISEEAFGIPFVQGPGHAVSLLALARSTSSISKSMTLNRLIETRTRGNVLDSSTVSFRSRTLVAIAKGKVRGAACISFGQVVGGTVKRILAMFGD